ncbi:MAG: ABC-type phosphate transport system substrate-binding protein [Candidatus Krumholzibacteriia bacterium]|jgi:ABC-type phosphate transport system substrate-binding protein
MKKHMMRLPVRPLLVGVLLLVSAMLAPLGARAAELVIIANPAQSGLDLQAKDLERIYMGKMSRWDNDEAIVPVMLKGGPVHEAFVESYLDRSPHRFVTYWRQMIFTGKGTPPKSFASEEELIAFVAATPGSVGYASAVTGGQDVKVLSISQD